MESMTYSSIVAQILQRPAALPSDATASDQLHLLYEDKHDLDQIIQVKQRHGWVLLSRSFSLDNGHGATLVRKAQKKAA